MATPSDNVLMLFIFSVDFGAIPTEMAQCGFWGTPGDGFPTTSGEWDDYLADLATAGKEAWAAEMPTGNFTGEMSLKSCKTIHYDAAGATANEGQESGGTAWAGSGGASLPWQVAQVVGLYSYTPGSFIPHARRRRGRVFLPALATSMMDTSGGDAGQGQFDQTKAEDNRDGVKAMLHNVQSALTTPGRGFVPVVYSRVAEHLYPLTDLTTDVRPDVQRRRADKLVVSRLSTGY